MRVKFISIEDLLEMIENEDKFKLVEVLPEKYYNEGHISSAINIPLENIGQATKHLDKRDKIVVYCSNYHCHASTQATKQLLEMGYKNAVDFKAGKKGWTDAGFGLEK